MEVREVRSVVVGGTLREKFEPSTFEVKCSVRKYLYDKGHI